MWDVTVLQTVEVNVRHIFDVSYLALHLALKLFLASTIEVHATDQSETVVDWPQSVLEDNRSVCDGADLREYSLLRVAPE